MAGGIIVWNLGYSCFGIRGESYGWLSALLMEKQISAIVFRLRIPASFSFFFFFNITSDNIVRGNIVIRLGCYILAATKVFVMNLLLFR